MRVNPLYSKRDFQMLGRTRPNMNTVRSNYFASLTLGFCLVVAAVLVTGALITGCLRFQ